MKIQVTQDHIDRGTPLSWTSCPIALAVNELMGVTCEVDGDSVNRWVGFDLVSCELPEEAVEFIDKFDRQQGVEPFEFELGDFVAADKSEGT